MTNTVYESFSIFSTAPKHTDKVYDAKELLGTHKVYSTRFDASGYKTIIFEKHFLSCVLTALGNSSTGRMGAAEFNFWGNYVNYQADMQDGVRNDVDVNTLTSKEKELELAYSTLGTWITNEIAGNTSNIASNYITDYKVN